MQKITFLAFSVVNNTDLSGKEVLDKRLYKNFRV